MMEAVANKMKSNNSVSRNSTGYGRRCGRGSVQPMVRDRIEKGLERMMMPGARGKGWAKQNSSMRIGDWSFRPEVTDDIEGENR